MKTCLFIYLWMKFIHGLLGMFEIITLPHMCKPYFLNREHPLRTSQREDEWGHHNQDMWEHGGRLVKVNKDVPFKY